MGLLDRTTKKLAEYNAATGKTKPQQEVTEKEINTEKETPDSSASAEEKQKGPISTMEIVVNIVSPEIRAVETSTSELTAALVLHLGTTLVKMRTTSAGEQEINLKLEGMDVHKCKLSAKSHAVEDATKLLNPVTIDLLMRSAPEQPREMDITLGEFQTLVSYRVRHQPLTSSYTLQFIN